MKKLLLSVAALLVSAVALAQTEQGKFVIGGSSDLSFISTSSEVDGNDAGDSSEFEFSVDGGYFVIDNLAVGLGVDLAFGKEEEPGFEEEKSTTFLVGPFARYYFLEDKIRPFAQGSVAFGKNKTEAGSNEFKSDAFAFGFDAGVAIFLNDNISIDAALGYARTKISPDVEGARDLEANGFGLAVGFNLFF